MPASPSYNIKGQRWPNARMRNLTMCDKCSELDKKIEHLEILAQRVLDQMTTDGIAELVRELRDEKKMLHPDQE